MIPRAETVLKRFVADRDSVSVPERRALKKVLEQIKADHANVLDRHEKAGFFSLTGQEKRIFNQITDLESDIKSALEQATFTV